MDSALRVPRPSEDVLLLTMAGLLATRGTCSKLQVGALIAHDGRVISCGYNGAPSGFPHCGPTDHRGDHCTLAVHAEVNAVSYAARRGLATEGGTLYTTHFPCVRCANNLINAGIKRVVYRDVYDSDVSQAGNRLSMGGVSFNKEMSR